MWLPGSRRAIPPTRLPSIARYANTCWTKTSHGGARADDGPDGPCSKLNVKLFRLAELALRSSDPFPARGHLQFRRRCPISASVFLCGNRPMFDLDLNAGAPAHEPDARPEAAAPNLDAELLDAYSH